MALIWRRDEFGQYADSFPQQLRYYVFREGRTWTVEVWRTVERAGLVVVRPGSAVDRDRYNPTARLAKAIAAAYDGDEGRPGYLNRMTHAIGVAYMEERGMDS